MTCSTVFGLSSMLPSKQAKVILTFLLLLFALSTITFPESSSGNLSGETALVTQPPPPIQKGKARGTRFLVAPSGLSSPNCHDNTNPLVSRMWTNLLGMDWSHQSPPDAQPLKPLKPMVIFDYEGRTTTGLLIEINSAQCLIGIFENLYNKNIANLYWSIIP